MTKIVNLLFWDAPLFVAVVDEMFVCRDINLIWRKHLGLATTAAVAIPIEKLFKLENDYSLMHQIEQVINQGDIIRGKSASLLEEKHSIKPTLKGLLSAWRIQHTQDESVSALLVFTETTKYSRGDQQTKTIANDARINS